MSTTLSIVIPSHNRADLLRACLASVCRYAPTDTEIVVVDDGSPDGCITTVAAQFAGVRTLRQARPTGFCAAANKGIRAAAGEIVELLNDDTEVTPGWAEAALVHFAKARVAAVAPLVLRWPGIEPSWIDSAGDRYYLGGVGAKHGHGEPLKLSQLHARRVFGASASSAFYRRELLLRVGAFPESFGAYFEDVDLSFRLNQAGGRVVFEPAARVLHHVAASYGWPKRRLLEQQARNEERVFWRNVPRAALARALPRHLAVLAGKAWRRWQEGTLRPWLVGRLRVLGELPDLLRHRRRLRGFTLADVHAWEVETQYWAR